MNHEPSPAVALTFALAEAALFGWICALLAGSFTGHVDAFADVAAGWRVLALLLAASFGAAPLWVYCDARRRGASLAWVHAAAFPLLNLVGLAAYLHNRPDA